IEFARIVPIELIDRNELVRLMFASKPAAANDDLYRSMCRQCGEIVEHRLRTHLSVKCPNGHEVVPTLSVDQVLGTTWGGRGARRTRRARRRSRSSGYFGQTQQTVSVPIKDDTVKDRRNAQNKRFDDGKPHSEAPPQTTD